MPSGRTHEAINLTALGLLSAGYLYGRTQGYGPPDEWAFAFVGGYLVGTFLITPDLDLAERRVTAKRYWGVLGWLWVPYGLLFRHRGWSHTWIVGPLSRLAYLVLLLYLLGWVAGGAAEALGVRWSLNAELERLSPGVLWGALVGYYVSQWMHLIADGIAPDHAFKRRASGRRRYR
ncbi:metal-binding protein [Marinithermus hydrothermalis]|uniref:Hydrolase n=1 Tax=Marinithermus hydrothermalis (strain DSM 14884 / JCM 11576 / T1) TaxID=869210 RepID=F2NN18_MARHT|nr:metal-binding protein [Marinithermus hydrothermalis]AEB12757.1 Protein of unknown function DUF2227, metal-binding protein [Marinithermus hydrothermalis DSM 14884]